MQIPHTIPDCYGSWFPTAVQIPLKEFIKRENYKICTTEIFGPFQIVVEYNNDEIDLVLEGFCFYCCCFLNFLKLFLSSLLYIVI